MSVRLIYHSLTGNTRKVAEAMGKGLGVRPVQVKDAEKIKEGDLLFLGDGVYGNRPSRAMRRFLNELPSLHGVKVALFGTYGGSPRHLDRMAGEVQAKGGEILGRFSCKGRDWVTLGFVARKHPTLEELQTAAAFARQMRERGQKG